ncbi:hypothetical protein [Streptomyces sp. NBC_00358]|uniref:hypothetical protein n=1 Tax=Streptomyces sp. NBC_00358 TaxID=2975725 RepID=UPI002E2559D1
MLPGTRVAKDGSYIAVQEGTWTLPAARRPRLARDGPATGPRHEIRLSGTASISVDEPFYDTDVNRPIDVRAFLGEADASARASRMHFAYRIDASGTITKLDRCWKA